MTHHSSRHTHNLLQWCINPSIPSPFYHCSCSMQEKKNLLFDSLPRCRQIKSTYTVGGNDHERIKKKKSLRPVWIDQTGLYLEHARRVILSIIWRIKTWKENATLIFHYLNFSLIFFNKIWSLNWKFLLVIVQECEKCRVGYKWMKWRKFTGPCPCEIARVIFKPPPLAK